MRSRSAQDDNNEKAYLATARSHAFASAQDDNSGKIIFGDCALAFVRAPLTMATLLYFHNLQAFNSSVINHLHRHAFEFSRLKRQ
jgi:hypothetical protein